MKSSSQSAGAEKLQPSVRIVPVAAATDSIRYADLSAFGFREMLHFLDADNIVSAAWLEARTWTGLTSCRQVDSLSVWRHFLPA